MQRASTWRVLGHRVNVRQSRDLSAPILDTKKQGDVVGVIEMADGWVRLDEWLGSEHDGWMLIYHASSGTQNVVPVTEAEETGDTRWEHSRGGMR